MTAEITKVSVNLVMEKMWHITLNLKLMDGVDELLSKDFSERYRTGQTISEIVERFREDMQAEIEKYKSEQQISNNPQLATAITNLQNSLVV